MDGPLVLRVDAEVVLHVGFRLDRKRALAQLVRNPVQQAIADGIQTFAGELVPPVGVIEADLHRVRAGDIRRAEPRVDAVGRREPRGINGTEREAGRLLHGGDHRGAQAADVSQIARCTVAVHARFEQQTVVHRRRPVDLRLPLQRVRTGLRRLRRDGQADSRRRVVDHVVVPADADLVLRRCLPRQAQLSALPHRGIERAPARVGLERPDVRVVEVLVVVHPRGVVGRALVPCRQEDPHLVFLERPAEPRVEVDVVLEAVAFTQSARLQRRGDVARLPRRARIAGEQRTGERVAAFARDDVDAYAASRVLGAGGRRIDVHLLRGDRVDVDRR